MLARSSHEALALAHRAVTQRCSRSGSTSATGYPSEPPSRSTRAATSSSAAGPSRDLLAGWNPASARADQGRRSHRDARPRHRHLRLVRAGRPRRRPVTGRPPRAPLAVTVVGPDLATADAYATAAFAMDENSPEWTAQLEGYEAMTLLANNTTVLTRSSRRPDLAANARSRFVSRAFADAPGRNRTCDLSLRRRTLYPLSYGRRRGTSVARWSFRPAIVTLAARRDVRDRA